MKIANVACQTRRVELLLLPESFIFVESGGCSEVAGWFPVATVDCSAQHKSEDVVNASAASPEHWRSPRNDASTQKCVQNHGISFQEVAEHRSSDPVKCRAGPFLETPIYHLPYTIYHMLYIIRYIIYHVLCTICHILYILYDMIHHIRAP